MSRTVMMRMSIFWINPVLAYSENLPKNEEKAKFNFSIFHVQVKFVRFSIVVAKTDFKVLKVFYYKNQ